MSSRKYNASKTYLLPLLSEMVDINKDFINELKNTYMFDSHNEHQECLYVLHDFNFRDPDFTAYEHKLLNNELFVKHIDMGDQVMYIFKFPKEYLNEYYMLQNGKYSEFGNDAKELILNFWTEMYGKIPGGINVILKIKQILYKDKKLRQQLEERLSSKGHAVSISDDAELGEWVDVKSETFQLQHEEVQ
jgi:hypothetical protein